MSKTIRIGSGSAWWGDRIEPAVWNVERGNINYLVFETMAEATVSAAQVRLRRDPSYLGYDTNLDARFRAVLPTCKEKGIKIISNQGWVNPVAACQRVIQLAKEMGLSNLKVAAIEGGIVTDRILDIGNTILESGKPVSSISDPIVSAEAYLGAEPIVKALQSGADIVITSRVADPSLFLAPMIYEFNWKYDDWATLGMGTGIGHLMECGAQVTGGYFADPGYKDVEEIWNLAFPIVEISEDGTAILSKVDGTGGEVSLRTCKEQLLYEVHDPENYITPDVVVDFTTVSLQEIKKDHVMITNISGKPRTPFYKVSIGCAEGFIGEDMFFFAGPGCLNKAKLAKEILLRRFERVQLKAEELRIDFLGVNAIHGPLSPEPEHEPYEVAVRVAARTKTKEEALKVGLEVDSMAVCGLASTGKRVPHHDRVREVIGIWSTLIPRTEIQPVIHIREV
ncbi:acyclic terpene utilization AtuA family protein [Effusibacillus dendaii]|uniref:ABC transporter substrate-binding protein n=1 Tax=Effusibacillus dendaii TaxID=2743772 RepID=A0A7I8D9S4_9BACL|nr:acyclic terpene utilization AtuA family protein [Effusibacillus dendaii]BCJ86908.1 ABC transporter substrate-binding protein [Effusibacillus dendaii]